jgi:hypothetical protein
MIARSTFIQETFPNNITIICASSGGRIAAAPLPRYFKLAG